MPENAPPTRRPIADVFRKTARTAVRVCVRLDIHPDTVSYASIVAAAVACASFAWSGQHPFLLLLGVCGCFLRLWFNMLDGMVALASGKASLRGEIINEAPDRVSDVLIFAGVAHSGLANPYLGYWVAIFALLIAYIATLGKAVGVHRDFTGTMAKQWRMVALCIGAIIVFVLHLISPGQAAPAPLGFSILDWTLIVILVGGVETLVKRQRNIFRALDAKSAAGKGG